MTTKQKIFFMTTHPQQGTGYSRVANILTNFLAETGKYDIVYYAFQNYPGQCIPDRTVHPSIRIIDALQQDSVSPMGFGDNGIVPHFMNENPDILFLYNDLCVTNSILDILEPFILRQKKNEKQGCKIIVYLDLVYPWEDLVRLKRLYQSVDKLFVFSEYWKHHIEKELMGFYGNMKKSKVFVFPHGVSPSIHPIDSKDAKTQLGFYPNDFLVLNANRNSYRKCNDITIKAFLEFLEKNHFDPAIKLYLNCSMVNKKDGYNIHLMLETECCKRKYSSEQYQKIVTQHIFHNPLATLSSDTFINTLYNACDVGLNTCCGEGFGLTILEHASVGKPQIVTHLPAIESAMNNISKNNISKNNISEKNISEKNNVKNLITYIPPKAWYTICNFETHGGEVAIISPEDVAKALHQNYKNYQVSNKNQENHRGNEKIQGWPVLLKQFLFDFSME